MVEVTNLEPNVDLIKLGEIEVILVGTAHVSISSVDLVTDVIEKHKPEVVAVELCDSRYQALMDPERWKNMDLLKVVRSGQAYVLLAQLMLASFQKKIGKKLGIRPGAEMLKAVEVAKKNGAEISLVDREVRITLKRAWNNLSFWGMLKLMAVMVGSLFSSKEITEEEIESLKQGDALSLAMKEFSEALPGIKTALISERDQYMAHKIGHIKSKKVVAIIGAGHAPGIKEWFGREVDMEELDRIPPPKKLYKILGWLIPSVVIAAIVYGFFAAGAKTSFDMFAAWFWINGFAGALGSALAVAHPLTVLSAFIASPFTSLNPMIAGGWVAGVVEAYFRKPRVMDLETIVDDVSSVKGLFTNRVSRILLVVALTNLCGTIGTLIGGGVVISFLKGL